MTFQEISKTQWDHEVCDKELYTPRTRPEFPRMGGNKPPIDPAWKRQKDVSLFSNIIDSFYMFPPIVDVDPNCNIIINILIIIKTYHGMVKLLILMK